MSVESPQPSGPATASRTAPSAGRTARPGGPVQPERRPLAGAVVGLVVVAALVAVMLVLNRAAATDDPPAAAPAPSASAAATEAPADGFPALPAGADPALASKPTVAAGSGELTKLTTTPLIKGTGPAVQAGQMITVNYVGVLYGTGEEFDSSWRRREPFEFQVGAGQVIPGWDRGLVGATVGSRVQLDIPAKLAYGENAPNGAPSGPLRFVVDILGAR